MQKEREVLNGHWPCTEFLGGGRGTGGIVFKIKQKGVRGGLWFKINQKIE